MQFLVFHLHYLFIYLFILLSKFVFCLRFNIHIIKQQLSFEYSEDPKN